MYSGHSPPELPFEPSPHSHSRDAQWTTSSLPPSIATLNWMTAGAKAIRGSARRETESPFSFSVPEAGTARRTASATARLDFPIVTEAYPIAYNPPLAMTTRVTIVGGGLAGCEAAFQLSRRGVGVDLHEMRPVRKTPVHRTGDLAELVCSNSLRGNALDQAAGLLKEEMRRLDSLVVRVADAVKVPAGSALAVD